MKATRIYARKLEAEYIRNHGCLELFDKREEVTVPFWDSDRFLTIFLVITVVFIWSIILI